MVTDINHKINVVHRYSTNYLTQKLKNPETKLNYKDDPSLDAWRGAAKFANDKFTESLMDKHVITKSLYEECGPNYLKEHRYSNCNY